MSTRVLRPQLPHGCRGEAAGEVVAQGLSSRRSAVGKAGAASPTPGRVRKRTIPCLPGSLSGNGQPCTSVPCPTFTSGLSRKSGGARAGVVALVRLETNFEYRNAAVRSAPPGSLFRVFLCREEH